VDFLGEFGVVNALAESRVIKPGARLRGLPQAPKDGRHSFAERTGRAVADLVIRYPVDHLLISPDVVLLDAVLRWSDAPFSVLLPPSSGADLAKNFQRLAGRRGDVQSLPALPPPRGSLPGLLILGCHTTTTCYLSEHARFALHTFTSRVLGLSILIDPTDLDAITPEHWEGTWTRAFSGAYRPAEDEEPEHPVLNEGASK
jgi:hypothetical protein